MTHKTEFTISDLVILKVVKQWIASESKANCKD